jgi:hypothetical protein
VLARFFHSGVVARHLTASNLVGVARPNGENDVP